MAEQKAPIPPPVDRAQIARAAEAARKRADRADKERIKQRREAIKGDKEKLTREIQAGSPEDFVMGAIGRSKNSAVESRSREGTTPLDRKIGTYGLLLQLKDGDTFNTPLEISMGGATYYVKEVHVGTATGSNGQPQQELTLHTTLSTSPDSTITGTSIKLNDVIADTEKELLAAAGPVQTGEPADVAFVRQYIDYRTSGKAIEQTTLIEAAKARGMLVQDDIINIALAQGKISENDARLLHGETFSVPGPDGSTKPAELSETAGKLKASLQDSPVPNEKQARAAFEALEIPTSSEQMGRITTAQERELAELRVQVELLKAKGADADGLDKHAALIRGKEDRIKQLGEAIESSERLKKDMKEFTGTESWDSLGGYYQQVNEGLTSAQSTALFREATADPSADSVRVLSDELLDKHFAHLDKVAKDRKKALLRKIAVNGGMGFAGINALLLWKAARRKEEGR